MLSDTHTLAARGCHQHIMRAFLNFVPDAYTITLDITRLPEQSSFICACGERAAWLLRQPNTPTPASPPTTALPMFHMDGHTYTSDDLNEMRQIFITSRDAAIKDFPKGIDTAVFYSHVIAVLSFLIEHYPAS